MTHDHRDDRWTDRLSEYLDGGLEPGERAELETHLAGCARCASVLDDLGAVVQRSRTLEPMAPPTDLWPGIRAEIEAAQHPVVVGSPAAKPAAARKPMDIRRHRDWGAWRLSLSIPQAAAAGLALALLSAGGMWVALRPTGSSVPRTTASVPTFTSPRGDSSPAAPPVGSEPLATAPARGGATGAPALRPAPSDVALAAFSDPRYDATIAELQRVLAEGRGRLDTTTVRILEQNLAIIDRALEEARRAVAADPANSYLRTHLASTMRRKVDLLRLATVIVGEHG